jgi:hypothetical protein
MMKIPGLNEISKKYIHILEANIELSKSDRHSIALLLLAHILGYKERKNRCKKPADIEASRADLQAYEEYRKTLGQEAALKKTFGNLHNESIEYMEHLITKLNFRTGKFVSNCLTNIWFNRMPGPKVAIDF